MSERRAKRLTPQERQQLVERWDLLYGELAALAAQETPGAAAEGTGRREELSREMDQIALQLREDWFAQLRQEMEGST
ncbi:MAG: hypothetical protein JSV19_09790 [Phycisphaerales bacterium]|nr:MAG: hypothetical protein JSV19_09790 [Phycisphaerales bacterium]